MFAPLVILVRNIVGQPKFVKPSLCTLKQLLMSATKWVLIGVAVKVGFD